MKNLIKKNVVLVMLFTVLCSYAKETSSILNNENGKTILVLKEVKQGEQVIIKDTYGVVLFEESIQQNGNYMKSFDLTGLPDGHYNFELDKALKTKIFPFKVSLNNVTFDKTNETVFYKPVVKLKDNVLYINKLNIGKAELKIKVYYKSEEGITLINSETIENALEIKRLYSLSKEKTGTYKIVFESNGKTSEKEIILL